eukprot:CAMPEP_0173168540 /NCGR_PEP_ID=MMETSP1141-20130122/205_1 /TAXON_ID=483371 /ORGANISM="non described non described, Strain CCMP2298" /LENGTH=41 /DNA_ID= /DNA_START= /DNA_END= /DNA_ORIENTATION=
MAQAALVRAPPALSTRRNLAARIPSPSAMHSRTSLSSCGLV